MVNRAALEYKSSVLEVGSGSWMNLARIHEFCAPKATNETKQKKNP